MILAQIYYVLGWLCLIAGVAGIAGSSAMSLPASYFPVSIGALVVGIMCFGLAEICENIGKISENGRKTVELLETLRDALANTDRLRGEEATSIRDLLVKVAISAPSIMPATASAPANPAVQALFRYSNDDSTVRGPFSVETVRAMIRDGMIRADTPVLLEGTQEWLTYAAFPELV